LQLGCVLILCNYTSVRLLGSLTRIRSFNHSPLSSTQRDWYKALLMKDVDVLARAEQGGSAHTQTTRNLLCNLFMQLRKCSNHPYLFDGAEPEEGATLSELVRASGKLSVLDMLLRKLCQNGHRVVLFSQFTMVLDIMQDYALERGWHYARLDGGTPRAKRDYLVNKFNAKDSPLFLFMMSTKAGGQGLNLQSADTCILFDSDWNPANDLQAMARVHRIGQSKPVHVYRLISSGTVEERMLERAQKKLLLDQSVNRDTSDKDGEHVVRRLGATELLADIKFGAQAIFGGNACNKLPTEEELVLITDR
jgi:SWI/SNF-related matrix-associated actin-dependent regulator of chromatin subfamily A member 5